ncbi:MAG: lipopolysaccharide kinase InaA family protein [Desulfobacteraceae bacterium]
MSTSGVYKKRYRAYTFGSFFNYGSTTFDKLIDIFKRDLKKEPGLLKGRISPEQTATAETGPIVVKSYMRGGLISLITRRKFLKTGTIRSKREFDFLVRAGQTGVNVPSPVAYAYTSRGLFFYEAWLITKEIPGHLSFVDICRHQQEKAAQLMPEISKTISTLVDNRIYHVDLHPGNILIDGNNRHYIVDFDKARYFPDKGKLIAKYRKRWIRSVHKYDLPGFLENLQLTGG